VSAASGPDRPATTIAVDDLGGAVGRHLGVTGWQEVDRLQLTLFAAATEAAPVGEEAPPYFALSLTNRLLPQLLEVTGAASGVNYGTGAVRFPTSIRAGQRVRGRATLTAAAEVAGGVQTTIEIRVEVDGDDQPACVVESLSRWLR
jgi:hypothetical protein